MTVRSQIDARLLRQLTVHSLTASATGGEHENHGTQRRDERAVGRCGGLWAGADAARATAKSCIAPDRTGSHQHESRPATQRRFDPQAQAAEPRCDKKSGLEKSECERRDVANDAAPAGVTTSMYEKERQIRADNEAATTASEADADSDTARRPSRSTTPMRQATRDRTNPDHDAEDDDARDESAQDDANRREQATESNSDADTLSPPRR